MQVEDERRHADQFKEQVRSSAFDFRLVHADFVLTSVCCADGEGQPAHEAVEATAGGG